MKLIEEEMTIAEFADRFLNTNDFKTPRVIDMDDLEIEIESYNKKTKEKEFKKIKSFVVKEGVSYHFTDGKLHGTNKHRIIENEKEISLEDHEDFFKILKPMDVVDLEVEDNHNYFANDRLNHNTTSGGKGIPFHASVRLRINKLTKIKNKDKIVGIKSKVFVDKSRIGPPFRSSEIELYFNRGMDPTASWLKAAKECKIVTTSGAWSTFEGKTFQGIDGFKEILNDETIKNKIYDEICEKYIMKYDNTSDFSVDDNVEEEE